MMSEKKKRVLKPCGTVAAARRHQRAGEPLCDLCRPVWGEYREQLRSRPVAAPKAAGPVPDGGGERLSELDEVRENLDLVKAAMQSAPPSAIAPLSRRREELDRQLRKLEEIEARRRALDRGSVDRSFSELVSGLGIDL